MPWNLSSCSESSPNAGASSTSSSLMSPRRWLLAALMDSFFEKPSCDVPSDRLAKTDAPPLDSLMPKNPRQAWLGLRARQRVRLATEAAGAACVVDRSSPSENDNLSHRPMHGIHNASRFRW